MAQARSFAKYIRIAAFCSASSLLILIFCSVTLGQGSTPQRGFQPGGSYALSDIETINTTNGNLSLHLPLGKLPGGRGGLSGQLNLHYDSKLYDSKTQWYQDWDHIVLGQPHVAIRNMLVTSDQGGWHYGTSYELQLIDRMSQYPSEIAPQYPAQETIYHYKVKVAFPDGSVHEFMPRVGSLIDQGYSDIRPDGYQSRFNGSSVQDVAYLTNNVTYYTFDGTYIRLEVQHDSDGNWWNNPWTLYFPDGMKVTNFGKRITDRNGNYVEFSEITYNSHPATQLVDQLGRKIIIEYGGVSNGELIHVPGVGGADVTYQVHWKGIQIFKTYSTVVDDHYSADGYPDMLNSQFVVSEIDLPAETGGLKYLFSYNAADSGSTPCCTPSYGWGELSSVTTPTGAQAQYQYQLDGENGPGFEYSWDAILRNQITQKTLTYQQQYDGNSTPVTEIWSYDPLNNNTVVNPDGGIVKQWNDAQRNYRTEFPDGTVVEKIWQANRPQGFSSTGAFDAYTGLDAYDPQRVNGYVKTEFTSIKDAGGALIKTAIKDYDYDKNGNVTRVAEYDWVSYGSVPRGGVWSLPTGIPASAVVKRVTTNTLARATPDASDSTSNNADSYWNDTAPSLRNAIASTQLSNGSATLSRTELTYDNPATTGNVTQQKSWDSTKGAYSSPLTSGNSISVSNQYDSYGNTTLSTDARGYQTQFVYGSIGGFTDLYPTQIKTAYQTSVQRTETREYDFSTGAVTRATDVDNNVSSSTTYDILGRPTLVKAAEGKPEETRTSTTYSDVNRRVIVKADLNTVGDGKLVSIQHYDQLGRVRLTRQLEDAATQSATDETTGIKVQTRYQYSGNFSYVLTSNPYRAATSASAGSETTMGWTRSKSDNGGHLIEVQTFAGATAPAPWGANSASTGTVLTTYDANFTKVTDQAGKVRRSMNDGLGRLSRVDEPDANGNLDLSNAPVQPTSYDYDAIGNLVTVSQGTQTRSFAYSSLSRLTSASNPESGTISYQYDNNGNLIQKTDARSIVTTYVYDALNRNTSVNYSNTTIGSPDVPDIMRFYDGATNGKGRFWYSYAAGNLSVGSNVEHSAIDSYDALGRPLVQRQLFKLNGNWGPTYQISRAYNLAGRVTTQTYPSGHTVTYNYDSAGRLADKDAQNLAFTGNLGDGVQRTYASGISYVSSGALKQEQFGTTTPVYNKLFYNSRLQLAEILTSTTGNDSSWNRGKIINDYSLQCSGLSCNATDNNGNLRKQQLYIPANDQVSSWTTWYQQYDYDSLNRLKRVHEYTGNTLLDWQQEYDYDRWGNRTLNASNTWIGNSGNPPNPALNETVFETGNLAAANRLYAPGDLALPDNQRRMRYDAAGNLCVDSYTGAGDRVYDAENRMTQAWANSQWQYYTYNADGQRTRRKINNQETWQVYGFDGELLAEYPANGAATSPQKEYGYRNGQLLVTADAAPVALTNVALAANGATVSASSTMVNPPYSYPVSATNNGDRKGLNAGAGGAWLSSTATFPQWVQVDFNGSKTISKIDVFSLQDNYANPIEPTDTTTFSLYGLTGFDVQYWTGSAWITVPGGSVSGNNKVWKQISFAPLTTSKIRVLINATVDGWSRVVEVEAWAEAPPANVALAANGATVSASSTMVNPPYSYPVSAINNGDRKGLNAGAGGAWLSSTATFPQWVQVDFNGSKTISRIGVFSLQDNYANPIEPTDTTTFSLYGLTGFDVQYWTGSAWTTVPGGSVSGNNKVWKQISFAPLTTSKIRVLINATVDGWSRVVEVEAWTGNPPSINWLVSDHLGTPRTVIDQTGTLANVKRHDYLPFGEELFTLGLRTSALGYASSDGIRQQFTQKERDNETGLDYFGARYYASAKGRFTSTDPSRKSIKATNPQTWNRYNYTLNNPLRYVDENGKWPTDTHNRIIEKAFRTLDPKLVRRIQRGSESVDRLGASPRTLYEDNAAQHAMTPGYKVKQMGSLDGAKDWARNEATRFINTNMSQAKDYYQKSNQTNDEASKLILTVGAFESFGKGAHTIMDGASPAHRDFQVYDARSYEVLGFLSPAVGVLAFGWDMKVHADAESRQPTDAEMNQMVDDLRMQFLNAFGKEAYERAVPEEDRKATEERKRKQEQ